MKQTLNQVRCTAARTLAANLGINQQQAWWEMGHLAMQALQIDETNFLAHENKTLAQPIQERLSQLVAARLQGKPLAHVLGTQPFLGLTLACGPAVLTPRPETELLTEIALTIANTTASRRIADLGTGSGAIAAWLAHKLPDATVIAFEASMTAYTIAQDNFARLNLANVTAYNDDWRACPADQDLIVCNPPYVTRSLCQNMRADGTLHDPLLALDGGPDGLTAIRDIVGIAQNSLRTGGMLVLEHGIGQHHAVTHITRAAGLTTYAWHRDYQGLKRIHCSQRI